MSAGRPEGKDPEGAVPIDCIYITGTRHSGSTVFASALAAHAGYAFPGEIHYVARALAHSEYCACGQRASACGFWQRVAEWWSAADGVEAPVDYEITRSRRETVASALLGGWLGGAARWEQRRYADTTRSLLEALRRTYGVTTVVDSSKSLGRLLQLLRIGLGRRVLVVHLVRDPLAVAASSRPSHAADPARGFERPVGGHAPWRTALTWTLGNLVIAVILRLARAFGVHAQRVRYERFIAEPQAVLAALTATPGSSPDAAGSGAGRIPVPMARQHVLCGNYVRMGGDTELRSPASRVGELTPDQRRLVRVLSRPVDRMLA